MKIFVRKSLFVVLGVALLCVPATVFAEPLDSGTSSQENQAVEAPLLAKNTASLQKELLVSIGHDTVVLEPNTQHEIFLDDISLGFYTSDYNGQLFVQVKIPISAQPGPHALKVLGRNGLAIQKIVEFVD